VKELLVNIYHTRVYPMFSMCAISVFLLVLTQWEHGHWASLHWGKPGTCISAAYYTHA